MGRFVVPFLAGFMACLAGCGGGGSDSQSSVDSEVPVNDSEVPVNPEWLEVRNTLDASDIPDLTLVVGTIDGDVFVHEKGTSTMDSVYELASGTKWLASAAIMRLVEDGVVSLDDHPQDYIDWWDTSGPRSEITLSQLLSFTSGFGGTAAQVSCVDEPATTIEDCVKEIYDNFFLYSPGQVFFYGPSHLQIAAFMVSQATGKTWQEIFDEGVVTQLGLIETKYVNASDINPRVAGGAVSTAREYSIFLKALLGGDLLQQAFPYMRVDRTDNGIYIADAFFVTELGYDWHYGYGEWRECNEPFWNENCQDNVSLSSAGAYGWYPWIDLERGYYGVLAMQLPFDLDNRPPIRAISLASTVRPLIEEALAKTNITKTGQVEKISADGESYANFEILSEVNKMTYQDGSGGIWLADLDPKTGSFATAFGKDMLLDTGAEPLKVTYNGAEFGVDQDGWSVFYSKRDDINSYVQIWRSEVQGSTVSSTPLTSQTSHMAAIPNRNAVAVSTRLLYINGNWDDGVLSWLDEDDPEKEFGFSVVDTVDTTHPTWIYDTNSLVFSHRAGDELGQIAMLDTDTGVVTTLTNDGGDKIFPFGWIAPDYDNEILVLALVDRNAIAIYRDVGETYWRRIATLRIPSVSPGIYVNSAQPFVAGGTSYISFNIKNNDASIPGQGDAEIWVSDLNDDPASRFALRCDDGDLKPTMRIDPKVYLGDDQVYVHYNVFTTSLDFEVQRCATGIATNR